jgi:hypothetical protein
LAASISVEAVTPPLVGLALVRELSLGGRTLERSGFSEEKNFAKYLESITYSHQHF